MANSAKKEKETVKKINTKHYTNPDNDARIGSMQQNKYAKRMKKGARHACRFQKVQGDSLERWEVPAR